MALGSEIDIYLPVPPPDTDEVSYLKNYIYEEHLKVSRTLQALVDRIAALEALHP